MRNSAITLTVTTINKVFIALCLISGTAYGAEPFTGGISLDKTAKLAQTSIPLPDGNPQTIIALAMRHGQAKGHFSGKAAAAIKMKFGKDVPIFVDAVKKEVIKGKPNCNRVQLTFKTVPEFEKMAPTQSIDIEACPNKK